MYTIIEHKQILDTSPTAICHASTLLKLDDSRIMFAWFGGSKEGEDDVKIWYTIKKGNIIKPPCILKDSINEPHWNPVLFRKDSETIFLFYKVGRAIKKWKTMICISYDNGQTWEEPMEMVEGDEGGGRGPVRNKAIRLTNGFILAPASTENGIWEAFVDISTDNGLSWNKSNSIKADNLTDYTIKITEKQRNIPVSEQSFCGRGVIQPTIWQSTDSNVHMLLRSTEGKIYKSDSNDFGKTWCRAYKIELPNNNSGIDVVRMANNNLVLAYNPVGENWGNRTPISLAISKDNGHSWMKFIDLDSGEGEFAYPAIIAEGDFVLVSYTYKRENIAFYKIKIV